MHKRTGEQRQPSEYAEDVGSVLCEQERAGKDCNSMITMNTKAACA